MMRWMLGAALVLAGACSSQERMSYRDLEAMANRQQREAIKATKKSPQVAVAPVGQEQPKL